MTQIIAFDASCYRDEGLFQKHLNCLTNERKERISSLKRMSSRWHALGTCLLMQRLGEKTGTDMSEKDMIYGRFGKPYLRNGGKELLFNISHSGDKVILFYSHKEDCIDDVGCDIEKHKRCNELIVGRRFSELEREFIYASAMDDRNRLFTDIWTLKESFVKTIGTGLKTDLSTFSVVPGRMEEVIQHVDKRTFITGTADIYSSYSSSWCIALREGDEKVRISPGIEYVDP